MKCLQCLQCLHCLYEMYEMFAMFAMLAVFAMFAVFAGQSAECPSVLRGVQATNLSFSSQVSSIAMMMITVLVVVIIGVTVENNSEIIAKGKGGVLPKSWHRQNSIHQLTMNIRVW